MSDFPPPIIGTGSPPLLRKGRKRKKGLPTDQKDFGQRLVRPIVYGLMGLMVLGCVGIVALILHGRLSELRWLSLSPPTESAIYLQPIRRAVERFKEESDGHPPADFAALVNAGFLSTKELVSPITEKKTPKIRNGEIFGDVDYVYFMLDVQTPGNVIMVYEKPGNFDNDGTNVLLCNGMVQWVTMEELKRLITEAQKHAERLKAAGCTSQPDNSNDAGMENLLL